MSYEFLVDSVDSNGNGQWKTATAGVVGNGGAVTQATNKATGVTLSTSTGKITMNNANLATLTVATFTLTNTLIAATDVVLVEHVSAGTPGAYTVTATPAAGSVAISVMNVTAGTLGEAIVLRFIRFPSADS